MVAIFPGNALMTLDEEGILSWEELFTPLGPPPPPVTLSLSLDEAEEDGEKEEMGENENALLEEDGCTK